MKPAHLFVSAVDGALHDARRPDWASTPLRPVFSRHFRQISTTAQLKATLRAGEHAWPGGYPLYFITSDGAALSFEGVRENLRHVLDSIRTRSNDGWRVVACEVNWENSAVYCDATGKHIPSAHGEDNAD